MLELRPSGVRRLGNMIEFCAWQEGRLMKARWLILALLFGLGLSVAPPTQAVSEQADRARISRLISQLASVKFSERRQASRELDAIGERALDDLRKAMTDPDL